MTVCPSDRSVENNNFGNKASSYLSEASFIDGIELIRDFDTKITKHIWGY